MNRIILFAILVVALVSANGNEDSIRCTNGQNVIIRFGANISKILKPYSHFQWATREQRLQEVTDLLRLNAAASQRNVLQYVRHQLQAQNSEIRSLWIPNVIFISNANCSLLKGLGQFSEIESIRPEEQFEQKNLKIYEQMTQKESITAAGWGFGKIDVNDAWNFPGENPKGEGIVVGSIDAGVSSYDLEDNHRESYGWFDSYSNTLEINDASGRGTHSMGTVVGQEGVGVAPGAEWIACKACGRSLCSEFALLECAQWMACPTLPNGTEPDCSKAPHIVLNTWTAGQDKNFFDEVIQIWRALDIIPVAHSGEFGPSCETLVTPGDRPGMISAGMTDENDELSYLSSKGPNRGQIGPMLVAPGVRIFSWWNGEGGLVGTTTTGGHSSAAHVAGVAALLKARDNGLSVTEIQNFIVEGLVTDSLVPTLYNCGGVNEKEFPNNAFGNGRVNAYNSVVLVEAAKNNNLS